MSTSLAVLREQGPMTLRDLTGATAKRMGCAQYYADVDAVMRRHLVAGDATCERAKDYRNTVWAPVAALDTTHTRQEEDRGA